LLAVLSAFVFFLILNASLRNRRLSLILALLFAFSATWWKFSTDAVAYVPAVLFLLVTFYLLLPDRPPRPLLVALVFSAGICVHQIAVIFYPVTALGLWLQTPSLAARRRVWLIIQSGSVACLLTIGAYCAALYARRGAFDTREFFHWITYHPSDSNFTFNLISGSLYTLRGQVRLFVGGRFNYLAGLVNPVSIALLLFLLVLIGALVFNLLPIRKRPAGYNAVALRQPIETRALMLLCATWILCYNAFLFVWLPFHTFYRLFYLPALVLLVGILLVTKTRMDQTKLRRIALLTAIMATTNFLFLIFPYAHVQKNPPLQLALEMNKVWLPGTIIFYGSSNPDNRLFNYFNPATEWRQLTPAEWNKLEGELQSMHAQTHSAWLDVTAAEGIAASPGGTAWLEAHSGGQPPYELRDPAYKIKYVQIMPLKR
jgi:hypothetical protein